VDEQDIFSSLSANTEALIFPLLEMNRLLNAELNALITLAPIIFKQIKKQGSLTIKNQQMHHYILCSF
jgi:hypothetical protein